MPAAHTVLCPNGTRPADLFQPADPADARRNPRLHALPRLTCLAPPVLYVPDHSSSRHAIPAEPGLCSPLQSCRRQSSPDRVAPRLPSSPCVGPCHGSQSLPMLSTTLAPGPSHASPATPSRFDPSRARPYPSVSRRPSLPRQSSRCRCAPDRNDEPRLPRTHNGIPCLTCDAMP